MSGVRRARATKSPAAAPDARAVPHCRDVPTNALSLTRRRRRRSCPARGPRRPDAPGGTCPLPGSSIEEGRPECRAGARAGDVPEDEVDHGDMVRRLGDQRLAGGRHVAHGAERDRDGRQARHTPSGGSIPYSAALAGPLRQVVDRAQDEEGRPVVALLFRFPVFSRSSSAATGFVSGPAIPRRKRA